MKIEIPGWDTSEIRGGDKQIDFAKDRVLIEVQLGKYFAMFYDMAKLEYFYRQNEADVGVEIVPSSHGWPPRCPRALAVAKCSMADIIGPASASFRRFPVKIIFIEP